MKKLVAVLVLIGALGAAWGQTTPNWAQRWTSLSRSEKYAWANGVIAGLEFTNFQTQTLSSADTLIVRNQGNLMLYCVITKYPDDLLSAMNFLYQDSANTELSFARIMSKAAIMVANEYLLPNPSVSIEANP